MEKIMIKHIQKKGKRIDIDFDITDGLKKYFLPKQHFFIEYTEDIERVPDSIAIIPLLANLLPFSWLTNSIVWVNELDKNFWNMIPYLKRAFSEMYHYNFQTEGELIVAKLMDNTYSTENKYITLFTGGVDAMTTYLRHEGKKPILFNVNGWYTNDITEDKVYDSDKKAIGNFADKEKIDFCLARSNFAKLINANSMNKEFAKKFKASWWFGFQHSLAFLGAAAILGYIHKVKSIYIGSSYTFGQEVRCVSDPRIDNCFRCASMECLHDGYELSRQDKVELLVKIQKKRKCEIPLQVCSFNAGNCCMCEKCFRTMLAIQAEGGDIFQFGFNIKDTMTKCVNKFLENNILELDKEHMVFWKDILERMKENYDILPEKQVCDFLENYPFEKKKKSFLKNYYRKNFFKIVKRKLGM